ncbi:chloride channel protein 2-like [Actinia tenebrosa]|uniref:Chloride channel protein 2-like n=1 Tax=Actinia tenebrosa TaxID=6105 RepID=A0A6P8IYG9_ACTTE|nr:chloride channel protein 2-like [Actinia tenebrosa]
MRHHRKTKIAKFLQSSRFIYPALVTFVISTMTFPQGLGQFMAGQLTQKQALDELFSNTTWSTTKLKDAADIEVLKHWDGANTNIYVTLVIFIVLKFLMTAVAVSLPIPAGVFFPVFLIGAAFGRLVGEAMATWFPNGIRDGDIVSPVVPGGYAVVGAAAMAGAVTHTISTSVIVFELTGQIVHILPVMIAVLIANAIAQWLQPSFYDSIIQIKSLPYLPDLTTTGVYDIMVADIMKTNLYYMTYQSTYAELKQLLEASDHRSYPLVDAPDSMILLGSIQRPQLISLLNQHLNKSLQVSSRAESEDVLCSRPGSPDSSSSLINDESRKEGPAVLEVEAQVSLPKNESNNKLNKSSILEKVPQRLHKLFGSGTNMSDIERVPENRDDSQTAEQQAQWEREILQMPIDFNSCKIDPAPFQLVERTSLLKVHKLFALLNLSHAYVTTLGRLAGLVSLKEVRQAIEGENYFDSTDVNTSSPDPLEFNDLSLETRQDVMLESKPSRSPNKVPHEQSPKL